MHLRGIVPLFLCLALFAAFPASTSHATEAAPDPTELRERMQRLIEFLDSPLYADIASWDEHLVLTYRKVRGRTPDPLEAFVLTRLHNEIGLPRSAVLSHLIRENSDTPGWDRLASFLKQSGSGDFVPDPEDRTIARGLGAAYPKALSDLARQMNLGEAAPPADGSDLRSWLRLLRDRRSPQHVAPLTVHQDFSIYFGYLHAHSELSDGTGDPLEAYQFARDIGGLDFFALTDHGELLELWPWENKWQRLRAAADATDMPGSFAALWGFEWSNPVLGHLNIINTQDFTGALRHFTLAEIYGWIAGRPAAISQFNHPGDYNLLGIEFRQLLPSPVARGQMIGIEVLNGNNGLDRYHYSGGYNSDLGFIDEGNLRGWRLGPVGTQDNHGRDWGIMNGFRTAVLATELSREGVLDAFRNRRFYATEDKDIELRFSSNGYPMGSELQGFMRSFEVKACHSHDSFRGVHLYRNGLLLESRAVDGSCVEESFADIHTRPAHYYVIVSLSDPHGGFVRGKQAISAPIWFRPSVDWPWWRR